MSLPSDSRKIEKPWLRALDALVFPSECVICGAEGERGPLCEPCREEVREASRVRACPRCAMPLAAYEHATRKGGCSECHGRSLGFDAAVALGPYDGPIRHLVLKMKRRSGGWLASWLIDLLMEVKGEAVRGLGVSQAVGVPLHWRRRLSRGHNQAEGLARELSRAVGGSYLEPLKRVQATEKLAGRGRTERADLLRGAFALRRPGVRLEGGVLLVDDVLTTGATCGAAARVLRKAGAGPIISVVIARAQGRV